MNNKSSIVAVLGCGVLGDGILSGIAFHQILGSLNVFTLVLSFFGALVITGVTVFTKPILDSNSVGLIFLWTAAILVDGITTAFGVLEYVNPSDSFQGLISTGLCLFLTGSSVMMLTFLDQ